MISTRRRRERIIRIGSWLVLALALFPALTYMGHWPAGGGDTHFEEHSSDAELHQDHCHSGVSRCAGGEAMVGSSWVGEESTLLSLDSPHVRVETARPVTSLEGQAPVLLQPPQAI
jgi:hypothetical protein